MKTRTTFSAKSTKKWNAFSDEIINSWFIFDIKYKPNQYYVFQLKFFRRFIKNFFLADSTK